MLTDKASLFALFILFLFVTVSSANTDIAVLLSFRAESDQSNSLASWVNSSDPCSGSWLGVTCDIETRRITRLVLENLNLTGSARPLTQLVHLRHLSLKHNCLGSSPSLDLSSWPNLKHLYLSHNCFAGEFPAGVSRLHRLQRLDLSHNVFSGKIPMAELAQLPRLLTVRFESNSFDGELGAINFSYNNSILDFNVSRNNLSGEIPAWLSRFDETAFGGNERLCGKPLPYECSNRTDQNESEKPDKNGGGLSRTAMLTTVISLAVAAVLAAIGVTAACYWRKKSRCLSRDGHPCDRPRGPSGVNGGPKSSREGMVVFDGCKKGIGGVSALLSASAEMLGKGTVGSTYKVVMDGGDAVVVKRVTEGRVGKEADWWLREIIGRLRHINIVSLRAYHRSQNHDDQLLLLVYDFLPNGSLHHLLHGYRGPGRTPLDWPTRLKLASDSARGLAFLHDQNHNKVKLYHGHLTSSNIIVDHSGNACLSDTALHQFLRVPLSPLSAYTAPELVTLSSSHGTSPRKFTRKCDVYSFGVVLLEILTGKMASVEVGETGLVKWVFQSVGREDWTWEVLDVELLRHKETEEQIMALVQVALLCLSHSPKDRPPMSVVHRMIEDIRTKGVGERQEMRSVMDDLTSAASSSPSSSQSTPKFVSCA